MYNKYDHIIPAHYFIIIYIDIYRFVFQVSHKQRSLRALSPVSRLVADTQKAVAKRLLHESGMSGLYRSHSLHVDSSASIMDTPKA